MQMTLGHASRGNVRYSPEDRGDAAVLLLPLIAGESANPLLAVCFDLRCLVFTAAVFLPHNPVGGETSGCLVAASGRGLRMI